MMMINWEEKLVDSSRLVIDLVTEFVEENPQSFDSLLRYALEEVPQYSSRAIRVVNDYINAHPGILASYIPVLVNYLKNAKSEGVEAGVLKLLLDFADHYTEEQEGYLVDYCFQRLSSSPQRVGIKICSALVLQKFIRKYPSLEPEFESILMDEYGKNTKGFDYTVRKVLGKKPL